MVQRNDTVKNASEALFALEGVTTEFTTLTGTVRGVNGASYHVNAGETLGLVGESGSGKSVSVMSALGLLPGNGKVTGGHAWFEGKDLVPMTPRQRANILGGEIGVIFQDPMTALNPVMSIADQIDESLRRHSRDLKTAKARKERIVELLADVGIPDPRGRMNQYPHQFSGGMRQRAMIAMALANRPKLLVADEPTTALDVTVQAQILDLLFSLQRDYGTAMIMITHDLGVVAEVAKDVVVMYGGRIIESGSVDDLFHGPRHPYTVGLLQSLPRVDDKKSVLYAIPGQPPDPRHLPSGCAFQPRCALSKGRPECFETTPLQTVGADHQAACHFYRELHVDPDLPLDEEGMGQ